MNPTIVKIIDMMFRGIPENEETAAMREELLTNSQARYDDLIAAGESPDTALGQVLDNLRGMEDVLEGYKTGKRSPLTTGSSDPFARFEQIAQEMDEKWDDLTDKAETAAKDTFDNAMDGLRTAMSNIAGIFTGGDTQTDPQTGAYRATDAVHSDGVPTCCWLPAYDQATLTMTFAPAEVSRINIQLTGEDIDVETSPDGRVHLEIAREDESLYLVELTGGCLVLRHKPYASSAMGQQAAQSEEFAGLGGILSGIGQAVRSALQSIRTSGDSLRLLVPDGLEQITLQTSSGDIDMESLRLSAVSVSTTSGDVEICDSTFTGQVRMNSTSGDLEISHCLFEAPLTLNTTSGDIEFRGNAPQLSVNTTSGDGEIMGELPVVAANTVSGDLVFHITCPNTQLKANATSGDLTVGLPHGTMPTVRTSTVSGDVSVTCATCEGSATTVQLSSVSGDLTLCNY